MANKNNQTTNQGEFNRHTTGQSGGKNVSQKKNVSSNTSKHNKDKSNTMMDEGR